MLKLISNFDDRNNMIKRATSIFRPLHLEGNPIGRIHLHDGSKILNTIQQGWLVYKNNTDDSSHDITQIDIEVRKARKLDLSKKDHFILKYADRDKSYFEEGYALYIYISDYTELPPTEYLNEEETEITKCYYNTFTLPCLVSMPEWDNKAEKLIYKEKPINQIIIESHREWIKTPKGEYLSDLTKEINKLAMLDLGQYEVSRLLKHFNIEKRA